VVNFNVGHIVFDPFVSWPTPNPKVVNVIINKGNKSNESFVTKEVRSLMSSLGNNVTPHFYLCKHASCSTVGLSVIVTYVTSQMLLEN